MLDALKGLAGGGKHQKRLEEFRTLIDSSREERLALREGLAALAVTRELIDSAREERRALSGALRQAIVGTTKMVETGKALESAEAKAKSSTASLEVLAKRIQELEHRAAALGEGDQRVEALAETTALAQRQAAKLSSLDGELESCRREVQQLRSQTGDTGASLEAFRRELAALEDVRKQFQQARGELKELEQGGNQAVALRLELDQMHVVAGQLAQDYKEIHDTAREVRKDSAAAARIVREVKRKLDVQAASLDVGLKQVVRGEKTLTRIDQIVQKTEAKLDEAARLRDEFVGETARMEKDGRALVDLMRTYIEGLAVEKQGVAAFDERLRALHGSVHDAERRMDALSASERQLESLSPRADELSGAFQALTRRADELGERQTGLDTAQEQLARVQDLASQATAQYESLRQHQAELDQHTARVTETIRFVEVFEGRLDALQTTATETVQTLLSQTEELGRKQAGLATLSEQLARVTERIQFVEMLEGRLNALNAVASDVDQKVVVHRASLEALKHERTALEEFRHDLQQSHFELKQVTQSVDQALAARTELEELAEYVNIHVERGAIEKKEIEAFDQRLLVLRGSVQDTEARMKALSTRESQLAYLPQRVEEFSRMFEVLMSQAHEIGQKQAGLETLQSELARVTEPMQFVETLEGRLNALHAVAAEVDQNLASQLKHRQELSPRKA